MAPKGEQQRKSDRWEAEAESYRGFDREPFNCSVLAGLLATLDRLGSGNFRLASNRAFRRVNHVGQLGGTTSRSITLDQSTPGQLLGSNTGVAELLDTLA
jgi:hypothetical protein